MPLNFRRFLPYLLLILSWLSIICAYFILTAYSKADWIFAVFAALSAITAMAFVVIAQSASNRLFYTSLSSLIIILIFLISALLKPLAPIKNIGQSAVSGLSQLILGNSPEDWAFPAKTAEEWIAHATSTDKGRTLNFKTFPNIPSWTHVCIFPGHSTDAQFTSIVKLELPWKLSDKSHSTTNRAVSAIAFIDEKTKNAVHIQDVNSAQFSFDSKLFRTCLTRSRSTLKRRMEATAEQGPIFGK